MNLSNLTNLPPHLLHMLKNASHVTITSNKEPTPQVPSVVSQPSEVESGTLNNKPENKSKRILTKNEKRIRKLKKSVLEKKKWKVVRKAGGEVWEDHTLEDWPEDDYRIFCGDLGNEVTDQVLSNAFRKYSSFIRARVVRSKRNNKTKGFGFVSLGDASDYIKAMREMNGKYVGNRPIRLMRSKWKERCLVNSTSQVQTVKFKKSRNRLDRKYMTKNNLQNNFNQQQQQNVDYDYTQQGNI